jgi:hypothetical protein
MGGAEFLREFRPGLQQFHAGDQHGRDGVGLLEVDLAAGLELQAGNPRLDRPHGVELALLEKRELVGIGRRASPARRRR